MGVNGSELIDNPWDTIFSPFTGLHGLGAAFFLIPILVISAALYIKTRDTTTVSIWLMASTFMMASGNMFVGHSEMAFVFYIFTVVGLIGVIVSIYLMKK